MVHRPAPLVETVRIGLELFLILSWGIIICSAYNFNRLELSKDLDIMENQCHIWISDQAEESLKVEILPVRHNGGKSIRIVGEYHILKINCTVTYPVDFVYFGTLPTEALFVEWSKEIVPESNFEYHQNYSVEVMVYSVRALFEYYNNISNSYYEDANEGLPHTIMHDYSRSGNYTFPGIFNQSVGSWFYLFLEDSEQQSFLRNSQTVGMKSLDKTLIIPCRTSHYDSNVEAHGPNGRLDVNNWNPIEGFVVTELPVHGNYNCTLKTSDDRILDTISYSFIPIVNGTYFEIGAQNGDIEIVSETPPTSTGYTNFIHHGCRWKTTNFELAQMISVPSPNAGALKFRQLFALPKFVNNSYTAKITRQVTQDLFPLRQMNGVNQRMGTIYCSPDAQMEKIIDFGCAVKTGTVVHLGFQQDLVYLNRQKFDITLQFGLRPQYPSEDKFLYIDSQVVFECRVLRTVIVKPVVWYLKRKYGTLIQDLIDYNLHDDLSINVVTISKDLESILCAGSYWYAEYWRNISYNLAAHDTKTATTPTIENLAEEYKFQLNSINNNIPCVSHGDPKPEIYFEKNGKRVNEVLTNSSHTILIFPKIDKSHAGIYTCVAKNVYTTTKMFKVVVANEEADNTGSSSITLVVIVPLVVFIITAVVADLYIRYEARIYRHSNIGLTEQEIQDFMKGISVNQAQIVQNGDPNDYNQSHWFALMKPYVKEYEIAPNRFQIDESKVLGKGQFGLVLLGFVDNIKVAAKTVQRNADKNHLKALLSELKILIHIGKHEHVIPLIGASTMDLKRGFAYVFVKFLHYGDLQFFLTSNKPYFDLSLKTWGVRTRNSKSFGPIDLILWAAQIASGMEHLAARNVIHGDLAARNVLLDEFKVVRLTDFGLSRRLYDGTEYIKRQQEALPWRWLAPESLQRLTFNKHTDVWAYGVTVWEIFSLGDVPYPGYVWNMDFMQELENGLRMGKPKYGTDEQFAIMKECWHAEPSLRPTFKDLKIRFESMMNTLATVAKLDRFEFDVHQGITKHQLLSSSEMSENYGKGIENNLECETTNNCDELKLKQIWTAQGYVYFNDLEM